ncbi:MAG: CHAP domain-containing protein, partial [bacterium]|nr:CHAP domain-containing protein [bacterium]
FLYYEGTDSTLPLQETHGIVEVRIGAGVSFGDDLFVQKINSLATCVTSDSVAYRVFSQECVPECAASLWNPWFNNLQCAVFIEGGQNCSGIKPIFGDAYQWFGVASRREDMAVYTNGAQCPRRGDVIVWQGGSQGWGHVAVVTDDGGLDRYDCSGRVEITQANTPRIKMNLNVYQGWIRAEGFEAAGFSLLGLIRRASF